METNQKSHKSIGALSPSTSVHFAKICVKLAVLYVQKRKTIYKNGHFPTFSSLRLILNFFLRGSDSSRVAHKARRKGSASLGVLDGPHGLLVQSIHQRNAGGDLQARKYSEKARTSLQKAEQAKAEYRRFLLPSNSFSDYTLSSNKIKRQKQLNLG